MRQGVPRAGLLLVGAAVGGPLAGCGPDCPSPNALNGRWDMYANVVTWTVDGDADAFPAAGSPANGATVWDIAVDADAAGATIGIDGQSFAGETAWDLVACGQFSLRLFGTYVASGGSTHVFETRGEFLAFGDSLEGTWGWSEGWARADGAASGSFSAQGQVRGVRLGEGEE